MSNLLTWALVGGGAYWLYKTNKADVLKAAAAAKDATTEVADTVQSAVPSTLFGLRGLGDEGGLTAPTAMSDVSWFSKKTVLPVVGAVSNPILAVAGTAVVVGGYLLATKGLKGLGCSSC